MRNHEGIRQVFRHFQHLCLGRGKPRRLIAGPQGKPHQQHRSAILPEAIGGNGHFAPRIDKLRAHFVAAPGNAHGSEQRLHRLAAFRGEGIHQCPADHAAGMSAKKLLSSGIGFRHTPRGAINNQRCISRKLEQQAIARFRLAQLRIIAFHGLLGFQQSLLHA